MAGSKGTIVRRSTRKAAEHDAKAVSDNGESDAGTPSQHKITQKAAEQPSLRRSKRAAAQASAEQEDDASPMGAAAGLAEEDDSAQDDADQDGNVTENDQSDASTDEEAAELDVFDDSTREAVETFETAVSEPAAFLQPSAEISELARTAAKVQALASSILHGMLHTAINTDLIATVIIV